MKNVFLAIEYYSDSQDELVIAAFESEELGRAYIEGIKKHELDFGDTGYCIRSIEFNPIYKPSLYKCLNCKKETYIESDECCEDTDLDLVEACVDNI